MTRSLARMSSTRPGSRAVPDRCPAGLEVHEAADGALVRVRLPGGRLTVGALQDLSAAAAEHGDPELEMTSRGNLQVRGLPAEAVAPLVDRVAAAGLLPSTSHERVRNVVASPLSGRSGGLLDVRGWVDQFDRGLCSDPHLADLSGRFLVALDDGRGDVRGMGADVGVTALGDRSVALELAGVDTGLRCPPEEAVALTLDAVRAFAAERRAQGGSAWRVTDLVDGVGEVAARLGRWPRGPGRLPPPTPSPVVGVTWQHDGRCALGILVPLGLLGPMQVAALARTASDEVVVTPWRAVLVPDLDPAVMPLVRADLGAAGLVDDPLSPWSRVTACVGRPGCSKARADVRSAAAQAISATDAGIPLPGGGRRVHWSGCERRCGRPRSSDGLGAVLDLVAAEDGRLQEHDSDETQEMAK